MATRRVLVMDGDLCHQSIQGDRTRMVGHHECSTCAGDVLDAPDLDPEPRLVERSKQRQVDMLGEVLIEAEIVDRVVPGKASTKEGQDSGDLSFDVFAKET